MRLGSPDAPLPKGITAPDEQRGFGCVAVSPGNDDPTHSRHLERICDLIGESLLNFVDVQSKFSFVVDIIASAAFTIAKQAPARQYDGVRRALHRAVDVGFGMGAKDSRE